MTRSDHIDKIGDLAARAGIRRVHMLAWRDLADVEAGGSELHAATVAKLWAQAGVDVLMRTSFAQGAPPVSRRDGYEVVRRAGRYLVFPRAVAAEIAGRHGGRDALVEIWNGVPWFTPLWATGPRVTWIHHVHGPMWEMVLPPSMARVGRSVERHVAPPLYRRTQIVTLSDSSKQELVHQLGFSPRRVRVVPPGIDAHFSPGGTKADHPLVLAVGRLMPVKAFDTLIRTVAPLRAQLPTLELVIVGEGAERDALEALVRDLDAEDWVRLPGRIDLDALRDLYRSAWVLASASVAEGWGMTVTEAAACGTPAVVTDIAGHRDAVVDGSSGVLAAPAALGDAIARVLTDDALRARLTTGALARAAQLTWEDTALGTMAALADDAERRRRR